MAKQIVAVSEHDYGFTTRYHVIYHDGSSEDVYWLQSEFLPFLRSRYPEPQYPEPTGYLPSKADLARIAAAWLYADVQSEWEDHEWWEDAAANLGVAHTGGFERAVLKQGRQARRAAAELTQ